MARPPRYLFSLVLGAAGMLAASVAASAPRAVVETRSGSFPATVRLIVQTGKPAPTGGTFMELADPALNDHGDLAFGALTTNPRAHAAVYLLAGGHLAALATTGQSSPSGGVFSAFNDVLLSNRDTVVFLAKATGREAPAGLFLARGGTVAPIVTVGQASPSGGVFTDFANPILNAREVVAFVGRTTGRTREGVFTSSEGTITPAVLGGERAPTGGTFEFFLDGTPAENDRGQIAFIAATTERATQGIYVLAGGRVIPVVTTDDEAPVGGKFTEFGNVLLTNAGTVGFIGRTARSSVREGLYVTGRAELVLLARQGQAVSGTTLTTFSDAAMNDDEAMVFQLGTPDVIPRAIYRAARAGVVPVVRAGDLAPSGGHFTAFSTPALNARGQMAFVAETDDGRHGIYLVTPR